MAVTEPSKCSYALEFATPLACDPSEMKDLEKTAEEWGFDLFARAGEADTPARADNDAARAAATADAAAATATAAADAAAGADAGGGSNAKPAVQGDDGGPSNMKELTAQIKKEALNKFGVPAEEKIGLMEAGGMLGKAIGDSLGFGGGGGGDRNDKKTEL